jgi:hypothetical protein
MTRSLWTWAGLVSILGLVSCTKVPGAVCREASGRTIENPGYCHLYPTRQAAAPDFTARRPAPSEELVGTK